MCRADCKAEALHIVLFYGKGNQKLPVSVCSVWVGLRDRKWGDLALKCESSTFKIDSDKYDLIQI